MADNEHRIIYRAVFESAGFLRRVEQTQQALRRARDENNAGLTQSNQALNQEGEAHRRAASGTDAHTNAVARNTAANRERLRSAQEANRAIENETDRHHRRLQQMAQVAEAARRAREREAMPPVQRLAQAAQGYQPVAEDERLNRERDRREAARRASEARAFARQAETFISPQTDERARAQIASEEAAARRTEERAAAAEEKARVRAERDEARRVAAEQVVAARREASEAKAQQRLAAQRASALARQERDEERARQRQEQAEFNAMSRRVQAQVDEIARVRAARERENAWRAREEERILREQQRRHIQSSRAQIDDLNAWGDAETRVRRDIDEEDRRFNSGILGRLGLRSRRRLEDDRDERDRIRRTGLLDGSQGDALNPITSGVKNLNKGVDNLIDSMNFWKVVWVAVVSAAGPLASMLTALGAAVVALGSYVTYMSGALAAVPGLFLSVASAAGAIMLAVKPITEVFQNWTALQKQQRLATDDTSKAMDTYERALKSSAKAQRALRDAQADLNKAFRDARRELADLRDAVQGAALDESDAVNALSRAQDNLKKVQATPSASYELDVAEAANAVARAEDNLNDTRRQNKRNYEDLQELESKGIEQSDQVVAAKQRIADANDAVIESQKQAIDAQKEAAGQSKTLANAMSNYQAALDQLSPSARTVVEKILSMKDGFKEFRKSIMEPMFAPLTDEFGNFNQIMISVHSVLYKASEALGGFFENAMKLFAGPEWTKDLITLGDSNKVNLTNLGNALLAIAEALKNIMVAAAPFTEWLTGAFARGAKGFADWTASARGSTIPEFLTTTKHYLQDTWDLIKNVGAALFGFFQGAKPLMDWILDRLVKHSEGWAASGREAGKLGSTFSEKLLSMKPLLSDMWKVLSQIIGGIVEFGADPKNMESTRSMLKDLSENILPTIGDMFTRLTQSGAFEKLLNAVDALVEGMAELTDAGIVDGLSSFVEGFTSFFNLLVELYKTPGIGQVLGTAVSILATLGGIALASKILFLDKLLIVAKYLIGNKAALAASMMGWFSGGTSSTTGTGTRPGTGAPIVTGGTANAGAAAGAGAAGSLEAAALQLQAAARALIGAAQTLSLARVGTTAVGGAPMMMGGAGAAGMANMGRYGSNGLYMPMFGGAGYQQTASGLWAPIGMAGAAGAAGTQGRPMPTRTPMTWKGKVGLAGAALAAAYLGYQLVKGSDVNKETNPSLLYSFDPASGLYVGQDGTALSEGDYNKAVQTYNSKQRKTPWSMSNLGSAGTGAMFGGMIGSAIPGVGTAVGTGVGAALGLRFSSVKELLTNPESRKDAGTWISAIMPELKLAQTIFGKIHGWVAGIGESIGKWFRGIKWGEIWQSAANGLDKYVIAPVFRFFQETLPRGFGNMTDTIGGFFGNLWSAAKKGLYDNIVAPIIGWYNDFKGKLSDLGDKINPAKLPGKAAEAVKETAGGAWESVKNFFSFADGGRVVGPGTARSDSILARLSNTEYVINAAAANSPGMNAILEGINGGFITAADLYGGLMPSAPAVSSTGNYKGGSTTNTTHNTINIHNPVAERASDSLAVRLQSLTYGRDR